MMSRLLEPPFSAIFSAPPCPPMVLRSFSTSGAWIYVPEDPPSKSTLLMTKFSNAGKIGCSGFLFRIVQFQQFQNTNMTEAKLEDLKIQGVLKQGMVLKGIKGIK
jgi:hypothetical protein